MTYPTKEAMAPLNRALNLPATGREQDWDIEAADPYRAGEFVAYFETHALDRDEKRALMALVSGSPEDLAYKGGVPAALWDRVRHLPREDLGLYADPVERWGPKEGDPDGFATSPLLAAF